MIKRVYSIALAIAVSAALGACATTKKEEPAPVAEPAAAAPAPEPKKVANDAYEVKRGDHLWGIASQPRIYGNPYAWPLIYKTNSAKIKDADLIYPGQNFDINRGASSSEVDAAVRHAKTRGAWKLGVTESTDTDYLAGKR